MSEILTLIQEAIANEKNNGFNVVQIDLNFDAHEALATLFRKESGDLFLVYIDKLLGLPVVIDNRVLKSKMFSLWKTAMT